MPDGAPVIGGSPRFAGGLPVFGGGQPLAPAAGSGAPRFTGVPMFTGAPVEAQTPSVAPSAPDGAGAPPPEAAAPKQPPAPIAPPPAPPPAEPEPIYDPMTGTQINSNPNGIEGGGALGRIGSAGVDAAAAGFGDQPLAAPTQEELGSLVNQTPEEARQPLLGTLRTANDILLRGGPQALDLFTRAGMAAITGAVGAGSKALEETGAVSPTTAGQIERDINTELIRRGGEGAHGFTPPDVPAPRERVEPPPLRTGPDEAPTPSASPSTESAVPSSGQPPMSSGTAPGHPIPPAPPPETPADVHAREAKDLAAWMDGKRPPATPLYQPEPNTPVSITLPDGSKARGLFQGREGQAATVQFFDEPGNPEGVRGKTITGDARSLTFAPMELTDAEQQNVAAHEAATSPLNNKKPPTPGQEDAENFELGHLDFQGLPISITHPEGAIRNGQPSPAHYGYIKGTVSADSTPTKRSQVDVYVGNNPKAPKAFIIDQIDPATGKFDEPKTFVGMDSEAQAIATYSQAFSDGSGPSRIGAVSTLPMPRFKRWLKTGDTTQPYKFKESAPSEISPVTEPAPPGRESPAAPGPIFQGEPLDVRDDARDYGSTDSGAAPSEGNAAGQAPQRASTNLGESLADASPKGSPGGSEAPGGAAPHPATPRIAQMLAETDLRPKVADIAKAGKVPVEEAKRILSYLAGKGGLIKQTGVNAYRKLPRRTAPMDIIEFLASKGGIKDTGGELRAMDLHQKFVPGIGRLVRRIGMDPDLAREAAQEAGYLPPDDPNAPPRSSLTELYDALDRTARGQRVFSENDRANLAEIGEKGIDERARDHLEQVADSLGLERRAGESDEDLGNRIREAEREELLKKPDELITPADHAALDEEREAIASEGMRDDSISDEERAYLEREFAEPQEASGIPSEHPGEAFVGDEAEQRPGAEEGDRDRREAGAGREAPEGQVDRQARFDAQRKASETERTNQGEQRTLGDAFGHISDAERAQRGADAGLKAKAPQKRADEGLFDVQGRGQQDLVDRAKAAPAKEPAKVASRRLIEDAGEKIGGARKDLWAQRGLALSDLEGMTGGEQSRFVTKDAVWPKPDYAALVASGMEPKAAALVKIIRDRLAATPRKDTPEGRRAFVETMNHVRAALEAVKSVDDVKRARESILYDRIGYPRDGRGPERNAASEKLFSIFKGSTEKLGVGYDDLRKADTLVRQGFPGEPEHPWLKNREIREQPAWRTVGPQGERQGAATFYISKNGKLEKGGFPTRDAAEAWLKEQYEARRAGGGEEAQVPERPHLDNVERSGRDVRGGRDVGSTDFVNDFGFRGVEFGNWVASDERQKVVNLAYDALHDLADVVGVDPKALSLDGQLSLAFGARGGGRFAAHYEPGKLVINMTKLSGAGSLGHEWAHALDHYFGELDRPDAYQGAARGASGWYKQEDYSGRERSRIDRTTGKVVTERRLGNLRPEMAEAFDKVMTAIFKRSKDRAEAVRDAELQLERLKGSIAEQEKRVETAKANAAQASSQQRRASAKFVRESEDWLTAQRSALGGAQKRLADLRGGAEVPLRQVDSSYYEQAKKLSGKSGSEGYWARPTEMFARAFESYLHDKIKERGESSQYLVQGVEPERFASGYKGNPYPVGAERQAINSAFGHLVETLQTRPGKSGKPAMFQRAFRPGEPTAKLTESREAIRQAVYDEIKRIAPGTAISVVDRHQFKYGDKVYQLHGSYLDGIITVALNSPDAIRTARHEVFHALRDLGLITPNEWKALARVSESTWMPHYDIEGQYADAYGRDAIGHERMVEEGVAEAFADFNPADRRAWAKQNLPPAVFNVFKRLWNFFHRVRSMLEGKGFHSLDDAFQARETFENIESGETGRRPWQRDPLAEQAAYAAEGLSESDDEMPHAQLAKPPEEGREERAEFPAGMDHAKPGRDLIEGAKRFLRGVAEDLQMKVAPMATGSDAAKVVAKKFANDMRVSQYRWTKADEFLEKSFTPEQRERMWRAGDEQSVLEQQGAATAGKGLDRLQPEERAAVDQLHAIGEPLWQRAKDVGIVKGEGLPSYMPRMLVDVAEDGTIGRLSGQGTTKRGGAGTRGLDTMGRNLTTSGPKHRSYLTAEETQGAAKGISRGANIVRDVRTLPLAYSRLERAIAGKELINSIKELGTWTGKETVVDGARDGFFTLDHPAFQTYRPRMRERAEPGPNGGLYEPVLDDAGNPVFDKTPIYVSREFEGPLRAVLTKESGAIYNAMMALKGKTMSVIMYSPLIHNEVEWGRAFGLMPLEMMKVGMAEMPLPGGMKMPVPVPKLYRDGFRLKQDPAQMVEAIKGGLVPIGHRGFNQDITGIAETPNLKPGRSLTAKIVGFPFGLINESAGNAVKRGFDQAGNFWHNTLLWDRVADLQMGIYQRILAKGLAKGLTREQAVIVAAHEANRFAGALPNESMSAGARKVANFVLFSRSFTMGNLGAMKDAINGLPRDLQAQLRASGADAKAIGAAGELAKSFAQRKAVGAVIKDIALAHLGVALVQSAINLYRNGDDWEKEAQGYADRWHRLVEAGSQSLYNVANPFADLNALSPSAENEPGKENRVDIGPNAQGTEIYARLPTGKIGEEFEGYLTSPLEMVRRKVGTVMRPLIEIYNNDAGFGRQVYDPNDPLIKEVADTVWHVLSAQAPVDAFKGVRDLATGQGDRATNIAKTVGPLGGITVSQGAPGGKAVGEMYAASKEHWNQVRNAMPDINRKIQSDDLQGAVQDMLKLGMNRGQIRAAIAHAENPASRLSKTAMRNAQLYMTPEQRDRMSRFVAESTPPARQP